MSDIKQGSVVSLKSEDKILMTVNAMWTEGVNDIYECVWFDVNNQIQAANFRLSSLKLITS